MLIVRLMAASPGVDEDNVLGLIVSSTVPCPTIPRPGIVAVASHQSLA